MKLSAATATIGCTCFAARAYVRRRRSWLKTAVTALVVALIEAGLDPCAAIQLREPLAAMERFTVDVGLTATAEAVDGRSWTALEMQRHVLGQIEAHADHPLMPAWTPEVCERLRRCWTAWRKGPRRWPRPWTGRSSWPCTRNWPGGGAWRGKPSRGGAKFFARRCQRPQADEEAFELHATADALAAALHFGRGRAAAGSALAQSPRSRPRNWMRCSPCARNCSRWIRASASWDRRACSAALERAGALQHAVPGVDNVEHAIAHPPATGRARLRADCVRQFQHERDRFACDWTGVWDRQQDRYLDLSDPFAAQARWRQASERQASPGGSVLDVLRRMLADGRRLYQQGCYERAGQVLENVRPLHGCLPPEHTWSGSACGRGCNAAAGSSTACRSSTAWPPSTATPSG